MLSWKLSRDDEDENWDVFWTDGGVTAEKFQKMKGFQKINHFPGMVALSRKNNLARNLTRMKKVFPKEYNFFPQTWLLPAEYNDIRKKYGNSRKAVFIVKPEASCQGRGIYLTKRLDEIDTSEQHFVVQEYVKRPLLIDDLKFDLRIYVLVAGCDPLRVYIHEEGLTRFATVEYKMPSRKNMNNLQMHLTNYAVNKNNPDFQQPEDEEAGGHKRTLISTYQHLESLGHDVEKLQKRIQSMIVKTLCAVQPSLAHVYKSCQPDDTTNGMCFEILGLDVMIDAKLKPYLIEVNHSPSFTTDSPLDQSIKRKVIYDSLNLMNVNPNMRREYLERKQKEAQKRALQGRDAQRCKAQRAEQHIEAQAARDVYESANLGGFTRIYPCENENRYQEYIDESERIWQHWTGARSYTRKPIVVEETKRSSVGTPNTSPLPDRSPAKITNIRPLKLKHPKALPMSVQSAIAPAPVPEVFSRLAANKAGNEKVPQQYPYNPEFFPEIRFDSFNDPKKTRFYQNLSVEEDGRQMRHISADKAKRVADS